MKTPVLLLVLALGSAIVNPAFAQPANDMFANRFVLVGTNVTVSGNNSGAGTEPGEDTGGGAIYRFYSVWYAWTAPTNGVVYLSGSTPVYNFFMSARIYRGTAVNALTLAPTTADGGVPVTPGDTIAIQITSIYYPLWGGGGSTGPFTLTLTLLTPAPTSPNDAFADRLEILAPTYHLDGGIYGATAEPGELLPAGTSQTLWWKFVAPEAGVLGVWVSTPQYTPSITLYEGESLGSLATVTPLNNYRYRLQSGHTYALQMASGYVPGGAFALDTRFFPMTNDFFAGSTHLEGTNLTYVGNDTTATFEPGEPDPGYSNTIWVSWAAPFTGRARYTRSVVEWLQPINVYTGSALNLLMPIRLVGLVNGRTDFLAEEGTVYHFQISGGADECNLSLQLFSWGPPTNDLFAEARRIAGQFVNGGPDEEWFGISDATAELGEPAHLDGAPFKSLWWKWTSPVHGNATFYADLSLADNVVLGVYQGNTVEALTLLAKGTNSVSWSVTGGNDYYIAAAVPTNEIGDVLLSGGISTQSSASRTVPGNILREPSWEGTGILDAQYWQMSSAVGGAVNESGGCDGSTWPTLGWDIQGNPGKVWQDVATVPGWRYEIRFAMRANEKYVGGGSGDGRVRVLWDGQEVGVGVLPEGETGFWHWADLTATASNATSRITFINAGRNIEVDAFSVVAMSEPPRMITQPVSLSTISGGTAAFVAGASGSPPLTYYWTLNGAPCATLSTPTLILENVAPAQAGIYQAVVSNAFGTATSDPATLVVDAPTQPVILWQPYGDTVGVGGYCQFNVAAAGSPPLSYQWLQDDVEIPGATNRMLVIASVDYTNGGNYVVRVANHAGIVWSLGARLTVVDAVNGGGKISFGNHFSPFGDDAPVFDIDGVTLLNGSNYVAQLYGGASLEVLRPAGQPTLFQSGFGAGYFYPELVTLPTIAPGSNGVFQVRAWDSQKGNTYEEARALGGRFGKSEPINAVVGGGTLPPARLLGLQSFQLRAGMSEFATGRISFLGRQPDGSLLWSHEGEPGFRYLIEKSLQQFEWRPFLVITNVTSTATFSDTPEETSAYYRSRILD